MYRISTSTNRPIPHHQLGRQFHAEWERLRRDPVALRRARSWNVVTGTLESLDDVLAAVGFEREASRDSESLLRELVLRARTDDLAATVVMQRLLPGALSTASRRRRAGNGDDAAVELLGALWMTIRTFNPARRPACLAAALIDDADYKAFRANWRRQTPTCCEQLPPELAQPDHDAEPAAELTELLDEALAAGVVDTQELALLHTLIAESSPTRAAVRLSVNERTVRNRRDRITAKLRDLALADAA